MPGISQTVREKPKDTRGALKRILSYLGSYKLLIAFIMLLCVLSNVLALLGPSMAGSAINEASAGVGKVNFDKVKHFALLMLITYISSSVLTIAINILMTAVSRYVSRKMRNDVFDKLMKLPVGYFDRNATGDIISRVSYDIDVVTTCIATDLVSIMTSVITVLGSFGMMVYISPSLSMVELIMIPLAAIYTVHMRKVTQPIFRRRSAAYGAMNGFVEEMFTGQKTILAYSYENEDEVCNRFDKINLDAADSSHDAEYYGCTIGPTVNVINNLGLCFIAILVK